MTKGVVQGRRHWNGQCGQGRTDFIKDSFLESFENAETAEKTWHMIFSYFFPFILGEFLWFMADLIIITRLFWCQKATSIKVAREGQIQNFWFLWFLDGAMVGDQEMSSESLRPFGQVEA